MSLSDLIHKDCIQLDLPAVAKDEVIRRMVDRLVETGIVADPAPVLAALLDREKVMSTGIGGGVAIPHAQSSAVNVLAVALARPASEVRFESLDEKPVRLVFMIVGPEERGGFIRILARISRLLYTGDLQKRLLAATTPEEVRAIIAEEEEKLRQ